jgi:hypothetical protein
VADVNERTSRLIKREEFTADYSLIIMKTIEFNQFYHDL